MTEKAISPIRRRLIEDMETGVQRQVTQSSPSSQNEHRSSRVRKTKVPQREGISTTSSAWTSTSDGADGNVGGSYANPSSSSRAARKSAVPKPSVKRP